MTKKNRDSSNEGAGAVLAPSPKKRGARQPQGLPRSLPIEDAREIAIRVIESHKDRWDKATDLCMRIFNAVDPPAARALFVLHDLASNKQEEMDQLQDGTPPTDSSPSHLMIPWNVAAAISNAWIAFAIKGEAKTLEEALGIETRQGAAPDRDRRHAYLLVAKRAVQVAWLMDTEQLSASAAIARVADEWRIAPDAVRKIFGMHRKSLGRSFRAVALANEQQAAMRTKRRGEKAGKVRPV